MWTCGVGGAGVVPRRAGGCSGGRSSQIWPHLAASVGLLLAPGCPCKTPLLLTPTRSFFWVCFALCNLRTCFCPSPGGGSEGRERRAGRGDCGEVFSDSASPGSAAAKPSCLGRGEPGGRHSSGLAGGSPGDKGEQPVASEMALPELS